MIIECENREEWLHERAKLDVNASSAAAIMGFNPQRNMFDMYVEKKTGHQLEDNDSMMLGRVMESGIASAYSHKTGRTVTDPGDYTIWVHDEYPWIGATLDRLTCPAVTPATLGQCVPLQLKHVGYANRRAWSKDEPPLWLQIQVQIEMACAGADWGAYCAVVGGSDIRFGDLYFNGKFFESSLKVFETFRNSLRTNTPPPVQSHRDLESVKALYPCDNGGTIDLNHEDKLLCDRLLILKSALKESEKEKKEIEAKLRLRLGDHESGILPDGRRIIASTITRKKYTKTIEEGTYRTLRILK